MAKEADSLPKIDVGFLTNNVKTKVKTKPSSEVQYSRKHSDNIDIKTRINNKATPIPSKIAVSDDLENIIRILGSKRTDQFFKLKSLADEEGIIQYSTKEIGTFLGIKKQATSNLCECLLKAGLINIYRDYDSKSMVPRLYKLVSKSTKGTK